MLRTILVPLDGSALAERVLPAALDIARRGGGRVHLVRAHVPLAIVGATAEGILTQDMLGADDALRDRARTYVTALATKLAGEWGLKVDAHVDDGSPADVIDTIADEVGAGIIIMTTHGAGGFAPGWLGSVTDAVIRHSHRPVLAFPENDAHKGTPFVPRRILVPLDGSERSDAIIAPARDLALLFGAHLDFVRVIAPYVPGDVASAMMADRPDPYGIDAQAAEAKDALARVVRGMEEHGLVAHSSVVVQSWPPRVILDHIKTTDPDCVAVATQGRGLTRLFVGSVADKLIRASQRPVLVLRPMKD
jgi:nucleotide-binding universal stress UspA family protein